MPATLQTKFLAVLTARGEFQIKTTAHYIVLSRKEGGFWYLGTAGALRVGSNITTSIPVSNVFKEKLLAEYHKGPSETEL